MLFLISLSLSLLVCFVYFFFSLSFFSCLFASSHSASFLFVYMSMSICWLTFISMCTGSASCLAWVLSSSVHSTASLFFFLSLWLLISPPENATHCPLSFFFFSFSFSFSLSLSVSPPLSLCLFALFISFFSHGLVLVQPNEEQSAWVGRTSSPRAFSRTPNPRAHRHRNKWLVHFSFFSLFLSAKCVFFLSLSLLLTRQRNTLKYEVKRERTAVNKTSQITFHSRALGRVKMLRFFLCHINDHVARDDIHSLIHSLCRLNKLMPYLASSPSLSLCLKVTNAQAEQSKERRLKEWKREREREREKEKRQWIPCSAVWRANLCDLLQLSMRKIKAIERARERKEMKSQCKR